MNKILRTLSQIKTGLSILIFFTGYFTCFGQNSHFAIVDDPDGYVNVRDNDNKIIDKIQSNTVVYCFEDENTENWQAVEYSRGGINDYGNIHTSKLKNLSKFTPIPLLQEKNNEAIFEKNNLKIILGKQPFEQNDNVFTFSQDGFTLLANGLIMWGTDGNRPKYEYSHIDIYINSQVYHLPKSAYSDLFEPSLNSTEVYFDQNKNIIYICTLNGDGAGGYYTIWVINNGIYTNRSVGHGF